MADAVFQEVLELTVDAAGFVSALEEIEAAYNDFADRLSAKGQEVGAVLSVGEFSALKDQLTELENYIQEFDASVVKSFDNVGESVGQVEQHVASLAVDLAAAQAAGAETGKQLEETGRQSGLSFNSLRRNIMGGNESLGEMILYLGELRLLWGAVGAVIDPIFALLRSPVTFFESGLKFLTQLQDESAQLQGVIAANAKYSSDLAENFKQAGIAAQAAILKMQELSISSGIPLANLQKTFESLLQSGALNFVSTMQDVVKLSQDFSILMQAAGSGMEGQRRILQDIPQLLEGNVSASSRILEVLGMTRDQWAAIRAEAQEHGNLVQLLEPYMRPYLSVVDQANQRQTALVESIKLQGDRIAAAVALPIWQAWIALLQDAKGFLEQHEAALVSLGSASVNLAEEFGKFVLELGAGVTQARSLHDILGEILTFVNNFVGGARLLVTIVETMAHELGVLFEALSHPTESILPFGDTNKFNRQIEQFEQNYRDKVKQIYADGQKIVEEYNSKQTTTIDPLGIGNILNQNVQPNKPLVDLNADKEAKQKFSELQQQYREELTATQEKFRAVQADIKEQLSSGDINFHQSAAARRDAFQQEFAAINQIIDKYKELANALKLDPKEQQRFTAQLNQLSSRVSGQTAVGISGTNAEENKQDLALQQKHDNDLRNLEIQHSKAMLEIYKQEAAAGLHTKTEVFDKEQELSAQEHAATIATLEDQLSAAKNNEQQRLTILDRIAAEDQRYTDSASIAANTRAALLNQEAAQDQQFANRKEQAQNQINRLLLEQKQLSGEVSTKVAQDAVALAKAEVDDAQKALDDANAHLQAANALGIHGEALDKLTLEQIQAQKNLDQAQVNAAKAQEQTASGEATQEVFGKGVSNLQDAFNGFDRSVESIGNAFKFFASAASSLVNAIKSGYQQGGLLGAIGGGASQAGGIVGAFNPVAGAIMEGVGSLFSFLGSLFTARAKEIAQDIQENVANLQQAYSTQQATLTQTIQGLEQQRQQAIEQLSGAKGGQDQLNKLLPQLNDQIAQMQFQASQIILNFNNMAASLHLQSSTLGGILTTWQQINKQVTDYLGAGGDAATAAQVLSDTLQQQLSNAQSSLTDAENQAVQDALKLNDLLQQRADLEKQLAQQLFDIQNSDSLERAGNPVIDNAIKYQQASQQAQLQLQSLNSQIDLMTKRVDLESQVFSIASDTASLQAESNQLNLDALQKTIQQWQDLKKLISSIYTNPDGTLGLNTSALSQPAQNTTTIQNLNLNVNGVQDGAQFATDLLTELNKETQYAGRYGS